MAAPAHRPPEPEPTAPARVSRPTDATERQADRVARSVPPRVAASHLGLPDTSAGGAAGQPLPPPVERAYGGWLGADLSGVRLHRGPGAQRSAAGFGAIAYTRGSDITLGAGSTAAGGIPGPSLLAHELTHVLQGGPGDTVHRQGVPDAGSGAQQSTPVRGTTTSNPLMTPVNPIPPYSSPQLSVQVPVPRLGTVDGPDVVEFVALANPVLRLRRDDLYVVPEQAVYASPEEARAHLPGSPFAPPTTGPVVTPPPPAGPTVSRFAGMRTVHALDGPLDVVTVSGGYIVTTAFTKYAVGAGSTTLVRTAAGWALVDAGMHQVAGSINDVLADALVDRIIADLGGEALVEVMLTHLHLDHTALLPRLYARIPIGTLRANAVQALTPSASGNGSQLDDLVRQMIAARRDRIRGEVRAALTGTFTPPAGTTDAKAALDAEVERVTMQRMQAIQATTIELAVPSGGQVTALPVPLGQISIPSPADPNPQPITQGNLSRGTLTLLDPSAATALSQVQAGKQPTGGVDRQSSTYMIPMPNSSLLIVLSDQRVDDVLRLQHAFESQLRRLDIKESFRLWDMTHHAQAGFVSGTAVVRSQQLAALTQMLSEFIDRRVAQGAGGSDALVVSVHGGAGGDSYIDPSHLWLLGSLGYSVLPATGGGTGTTAAQDISVLDVVLKDGKKVSGVAGPSWLAGSPQDPLLRKAGAAVTFLKEQAAQLTQQAQAAEAAQKPALQSQAGSADQAREAIEAARTAYIAAVRAQIGRSHRDPATSGRPDTAPATGAPEPAATEAATLRSLLAGFTAPVVGETPRFSNAALVVIGRAQMAAQDEPTRRLLAARGRVQELAAGLKWSASPARRNQVAAALDAYRTELRTYLARASAADRPVLEHELQNIDNDVFRLTGLSPSDYAQAQQAAALADQVSRQTAGAATVTFEELSDNARADRIIKENNGFALVGGRLYRLTASGGGVQVSAVPLLPAAVPRAASAPPPATAPAALPAVTAPPGGAGAGGGGGAVPPRQPIVVPGPIPAEFLNQPNIINISGRTIIFEGAGAPLPATASGTIEGLKPGELFVRGYTSQWVVAEPGTGRPIAVARTGGEVWQVQSGGWLTLVVDAYGNVQAENAPSIVARPGALPTGGAKVPTPEAVTGGPGAGTKAVAGGMGLFLVVNEILTPIARVLQQQQYNIALSEAQYRFWVQFGANPTWEMRTQNTRETQPSTTAPDTAVFSQPVYRYITNIDVAALSASLDRELQTYQDLELWLDAAHQIQAIDTKPQMEPFMTAEQRAKPRTHQTWVAGEPGQRSGRMVDLTAVIQRQETRVLAALDTEMRGKLAALPTDARKQVHRLKKGSETRVYRLADSGWLHGSEPILSASSMLGPDPWVRILDHKAGRARVEAVNADARRSALISAYQIDKEIDDVLKEVTKGGRPVTSRQERYGSLESFVAGPMPGDTRFGVTRYYRHQQEPKIWTVAIGQLNEFWVDEDDLVLVDEAAVSASLNAGQAAPTTGGAGSAAKP